MKWGKTNQFIISPTFVLHLDILAHWAIVIYWRERLFTEDSFSSVRVQGEFTLQAEKGLMQRAPTCTLWMTR